MMRFIDLTNQIMIPYDETKEKWCEFAFFNTVNDRFVEFLGVQTWHTMEDFIHSIKHDTQNPYRNEIDRFLGLIPKNFFDGNEEP